MNRVKEHMGRTIGELFEQRMEDKQRWLDIEPVYGELLYAAHKHGVKSERVQRELKIALDEYLDARWGELLDELETANPQLHEVVNSDG